MARVLVTGASGFVGRATCEAFLEAGWSVAAAVRTEEARRRVPAGCAAFVVGDITAAPEWSRPLDGVDVVVHLAARVHVMVEHDPEAPRAYRAANVDATVRLAEDAARAGARRFVYVSSVKAVAERSDAPLGDDTEPRPLDAYGRSKRDAELALADVAARTGLEVVVIRPPLVYGPGVGGNFRRLVTLLRLAARVPLPLAGGARRSFVYVRNLASALVAAATHPAAAGKTFFVRDGRDLTTGELLHALGAALDVRPRLFRMPRPVLSVAAALVGRRAEVDRLLGPLQVDDARIRALLAWTPPVSVETALATTARALVAARATPAATPAPARPRG